MKESFKYTFLTVAEIKKFSVVVLIMSIFTVIQPFPVISIISFLMEKILYLSIGAILIYIANNTKNDEEYYATLKKQPLSTFFLHFLPTAMGIMLGIFVLAAIFLAVFVFILKITNSVYILINPHTFFIQIANSPILTQTLLGFYSVYLIFYSYIFLGKLGEALSKENFKESFLSMLSTIYDFKFWINSFNLKYMLIFFVWSFIISITYSVVALMYLFYLFPLLLNDFGINVLIIPILVSITTILTYYTYFSAYFAYKSTAKN